MDEMNMDFEPSNYHRPSAESIMKVRSLMHKRLLLPHEVISIILDEASYWVSSLTQTPHTPHTYTETRMLLASPPLGTTHCTLIDAGFGRQVPKVGLRGQRPCREIRVTYQAMATQEPDGGCTLSNSTFHMDTFHSQASLGSESLSPDSQALEIRVVKAGKDGWAGFGMGGPQEDWRKTFGQHPSKVRRHVDKFGRLVEEGTSVDDTLNTTCQPVLQGTSLLVKQVTTGASVWQWTDQDEGGEMVRNMGSGDSVEVWSNLYNHAWGIRIWQLDLEIFYAV